jgi:hypothetical protein
MRPDQKQIMDNVFNAVSYVTTVGFDDFVSKRRFRWIMNARIPFSHICFNRYCEDGEQSNGCSILTLEVIGEYMRKNHASIINQRKRAKDFLFSDPSFKRKLRDIEDLLLTHEVVLPTDRLLWSSQVDAVFDSAPSGKADAVATNNVTD